MSEDNSIRNFIGRTAFPILLGSLLTLGTGLVAASATRSKTDLKELRESYATFFAEMDELNAGVDAYYDGLYHVVRRYYSNNGNFLGRSMTTSDLDSLSHLSATQANLERKLRKLTFSALLREPNEEWRTSIKVYADSTLSYLNECARIARLLPNRHRYDASLAKRNGGQRYAHPAAGQSFRSV